MAKKITRKDRARAARKAAAAHVSQATLNTIAEMQKAEGEFLLKQVHANMTKMQHRNPKLYADFSAKWEALVAEIGEVAAARRVMMADDMQQPPVGYIGHMRSKIFDRTKRLLGAAVAQVAGAAPATRTDSFGPGVRSDQKHEAPPR